MKKFGSIVCKIKSVCPGWIDAETKAGSSITFYLKTDMTENLKKAMESFIASQHYISMLCVKNKHGDFVFGGFKTHAKYHIAHKTKRIKAEAELRTIERETHNPVRGRNIRQSAAKHSLAAKKGTAKLTKIVRDLVVNSVANERDEKLNLLP